MEVLSLYSELRTESDEPLRVCYRLLEERDGFETRYGILSFVEGEDPRREERRYLPGCFANRRMAELVLGYLAESAVLPRELEETLREAFA